MSTVFGIWFAASVLVSIAEQSMFVSMLRRLGVNVSYFMSGTPLYPEFLYFNWCKANGRSPFKRLALRGLILVNDVIVISIAMSHIPDG